MVAFFRLAGCAVVVLSGILFASLRFTTTSGPPHTETAPLAGPLVELPPNLDFQHEPLAAFHPHGDTICASGCSLANHPTDRLTDRHFTELMGQFAVEPTDETSLALETLLFYGRQTKYLLASHESSLDRNRFDFLQAELEKSNVRVSLRLIDEFQEIQAHLPDTSVPLDRRHVFSMTVIDGSKLDASGTVKRVGLHHLWTRL